MGVAGSNHLLGSGGGTREMRLLWIMGGLGLRLAGFRGGGALPRSYASFPIRSGSSGLRDCGSLHVKVIGTNFLLGQNRPRRQQQGSGKNNALQTGHGMGWVVHGLLLGYGPDGLRRGAARLRARPTRRARKGAMWDIGNGGLKTTARPKGFCLGYLAASSCAARVSA